MQWYRILLNNDQIAEGHLMALTQQCAKLFLQQGTADAAVFAGDKIFSGAPDDYGVIPVYFSPGSIAICQGIIISYSALPCDKPPKEVSLLAGRAGSRKLLR